MHNPGGKSYALEFIERFFWHILNDESHSKELNSHIKIAYKETLQTYHGYLLQKTFGVSALMIRFNEIATY